MSGSALWCVVLRVTGLAHGARVSGPDLAYLHSSVSQRHREWEGIHPPSMPPPPFLFVLKRVYAGMFSLFLAALVLSAFFLLLFSPACPSVFSSFFRWGRGLQDLTPVPCLDWSNMGG
eukprot:411112-Rhodomonas_salina.1